jgi:uncharacterized membrane-anchored protein YhcB (DUF1043 family)
MDMAEKYIVFWMVQALILLFGIAIGHSFLLLRLRREENRRRELELMLLEKRTEILKQGRKVAQDLEDALYKAKVQQEIDDIIRKD